MVYENLLKVYQKHAGDELILFKLELLTEGMAEQFIRYFRGKKPIGLKNSGIIL